MDMNKTMKNPKNQQGAALIVGLVLLLVMTVLGVSTMRTASLELNMAGNNQFFQNAFQLAETGNDVMLQNLNSGAQAIPSVTDPDATICDPAGAEVNVAGMGGTYQNTLCVIGIRGCGSGASCGKVSTIHFQNSSQGVAQGGASSLHRQGLRIEAPGL